MITYTIGSEGVKKVKKEVTFNFILIMFIMLVFVIAITLPDMHNLSFADCFGTLISLVVMSIGMRRGVIRAKKIILENYSLIIDDEVITRRIVGSPDIRLHFGEVSQITKSNRDSFAIKSDIRNSTIYVYPHLDNIDKLEATLATIQPITLKQGLFNSRYVTYMLMLVVVTAMYTLYTSVNKTIVGASGALLIAVLGCSFWVIQTNKNADAKTKRTSWFAIIVLLSIAATVYFKLSA